MFLRVASRLSLSSTHLNTVMVNSIYFAIMMQGGSERMKLKCIAAPAPAPPARPPSTPSSPLFTLRVLQSVYRM